jgi:hypothetical protein
MRIFVLTISALSLAVSSCSGPTSEKPVDKPDEENAALSKPSSDAEAVAHEANSINQAAEKAAAMVEAEGKAEIKEMDGQAQSHAN